MTKKILLIIAPDNFRDEEYFDTKQEIEAAGFKTITANSTGQRSKSSFGKIVKPNKNIYDVSSEKFDAIVFVGGEGARIYFDNNRALELAKEFFNSGKIVSAICIAPVILVNAGFMLGKKATGFPSIRDEIKAVGTYTGEPVEVDGNIITANGPKAAKEFGMKIVQALSKEKNQKD